MASSSPDPDSPDGITFSLVSSFGSVLKDTTHRSLKSLNRADELLSFD
jgi:hypothetical protein